MSTEPKNKLSPAEPETPSQPPVHPLGVAVPLGPTPSTNITSPKPFFSPSSFTSSSPSGSPACPCIPNPAAGSLTGPNSFPSCPSSYSIPTCCCDVFKVRQSNLSGFTVSHGSSQTVSYGTFGGSDYDNDSMHGTNSFTVNHAGKYITWFNCALQMVGTPSSGSSGEVQLVVNGSPDVGIAIGPMLGTGAALGSLNLSIERQYSMGDVVTFKVTNNDAANIIDFNNIIAGMTQGGGL